MLAVDNMRLAVVILFFTLSNIFLSYNSWHPRLPPIDKHKYCILSLEQIKSDLLLLGMIWLWLKGTSASVLPHPSQ